MMNPETDLPFIIPKPEEASKLHFYLAWGCPFCHRVFAALVFTGLQDEVSVTWVANIKGVAGWEISPDEEPLINASSLSQVYAYLAPAGMATASVPLLVDLVSGELLSTDSMQMVRFISRGMNGRYEPAIDLCPARLVEKVNELNAWLHDKINREVYRVGFAESQKKYVAKVEELFASIDRLECRLGSESCLLGDTLTESDLFLMPTLMRFESIYYPLFKCSKKHLFEYPKLYSYLARLRGLDGFRNSYDHQLTKQHYYCSVLHSNGEIRDLNPTRLVPVDSCQLSRDILKVRSNTDHLASKCCVNGEVNQP